MQEKIISYMKFIEKYEQNLPIDIKFTELNIVLNNNLNEKINNENTDTFIYYSELLEFCIFLNRVFEDIEDEELQNIVLQQNTEFSNVFNRLYLIKFDIYSLDKLIFNIDTCDKMSLGLLEDFYLYYEMEEYVSVINTYNDNLDKNINNEINNYIKTINDINNYFFK